LGRVVHDELLTRFIDPPCIH